MSNEMTMTNKKQRLRAVDRTFAKAFANYAPPEALTVSEWAAKYRVLPRESSAEAGRWRNERTPYMVEIMDAFTDPQVHKISVVAGAQIGKTEALLNALGYIVDQDPGGVLFVQPTIDDCKKFSKFRISPMIRDCPKLRGKLKDMNSRDNANTILQKSFPGGNLIMVGSNAPSGLASNPMRYILGDEIDRWALSAGTEGDPYTLAEKRTQTFYNHKIFTVSTPTIKGNSKIDELFHDGTQERWCYQCPDCREWHCIVLDDVKFSFDTVKIGRKKDYIVKLVNWCCPSCGTVHTESEMRAQPAKWIADNPAAIEKGHRSFKIGGFASPWQPWDKIVYEFLSTRKDPDRFKVFYNTTLGETFEDRGDLEDEDSMLARREDYGTREDGTPVELPDGVLVLTCGVDVQDDRLEFETVGHGHYGETWGIKKGIIYGDPNDDAPWERLDDVINHTYKFRNGRGLTISMTCVDSGGHKTQAVYKQCRARLLRRVFAIKGAGGDGVPYTRPPSKVKIVVDGKAIGTIWLYSLGVDAGKAAIMSSLKVQEPGPKYCHFPRGEDRGYDITYFNGLLSEKLVMKSERGRTRWAWVKLPGHERNEPLDCRNYAMAAFRILDPDLDAVERRLRGLESADNRQEAQNQKPKRSKIRKNSRIAGSDDW